MLAYELRQFPAEPRVGSERQVGFDAVLERGEAQLGESGDVRLRERLEGEVGQRFATPQGQGGTQRRRGGGGVAVEDLPGLSDQAFELGGVDLLRIHREEVAGLTGDE